MRYAAQRLGLIAIFALLLFASAGTWAWPRGWAYVAVVLVLEVVTLVLLALRAPETLRRRGEAGAGVEPFDRVFAGLWLTLALATPVVAGLDAVRFRWSSLPWWCFGLGLAVLVPAALFGAWAMLVNEHFEQLVRIQTDRGHRVVADGPYRLVRHPGYLATVAGALATPLLLGSVWTLMPAALVAALFVVRTSLEDATLQRELPGYAEYATRTRFQLVPGVW